MTVDRLSENPWDTQRLLGSVELVMGWWWRFNSCHRDQQSNVGSFGDPINLFGHRRWCRSLDRLHVHDRPSSLGRDHQGFGSGGVHRSRGRGRGARPCVESSRGDEERATDHCDEVVSVHGGYHGCHDHRGHLEVDRVQNRIAMRQTVVCEPTAS